MCVKNTMILHVSTFQSHSNVRTYARTHPHTSKAHWTRKSKYLDRCNYANWWKIVLQTKWQMIMRFNKICIKYEHLQNVTNTNQTNTHTHFLSLFLPVRNTIIIIYDQFLWVSFNSAHWCRRPCCRNRLPLSFILGFIWCMATFLVTANGKCVASANK